MQGHSHMDGISWFADREESADPQTSRVKITVVPPDDTADVMANTGVARETIRTHMTKTLIFFIEEM